MQSRWLSAIPAVMFHAGALVGAVIFCLGCGQEPTYQGKPLSKWKAEADDKDPALRLAAVKALGEFGPEATPLLVRLLRHEDEKVRDEAAANLGRLAAEDQAAAVPWIMPLLRDQQKDVRRIAAYTLSRMGPAAKAAIPDLIKLLQDKDPATRCEAAWTLGEMGLQAATAVPALTDLLQDEDNGVRSVAATAIKKIQTGVVP